MKFLIDLIDTIHIGSPPAWGAWIEMKNTSGIGTIGNVAPRMGGVD